jgi:uncharacterized Zn ribbon protein
MSDEIYYDEERNIIPMPLEEWKEYWSTREKDWKVLDAYGTELQSGDSIISIKPLPVKKWVDIKQGEKFTRIKLTDDPELVLAKHDKNGEMYLRTEFFKKA